MLIERGSLVGSLTVAFLLGCAAQTNSGDLDSLAGSPRGADGAGSGGDAATGGPSTGVTAGAPSGTSGAPSSVEAGGAANGAGNAPGAAGSGNAAGSVGNGGSSSVPVTAGLPFDETFESGMIDHGLWYAVADQIVDPAYTGWSVVAANTGKAAKLVADGNEQYLEGGNGSWTDVKVEMRVQVMSGSPEVDVAVRYHGVKEYYYLSFGNSLFKIRDRTSANSDLFPTTKPMQVAGTWYKIAIQIQGTQMTAWLDGVMLTTGSFASKPIAAGGIAFGVRDGTGVALFDDIHVTAP